MKLHQPAQDADLSKATKPALIARIRILEEHRDTWRRIGSEALAALRGAGHGDVADSIRDRTTAELAQGEQ